MALVVHAVILHGIFRVVRKWSLKYSAFIYDPYSRPVAAESVFLTSLFLFGDVELVALLLRKFAFAKAWHSAFMFCLFNIALGIIGWGINSPSSDTRNTTHSVQYVFFIITIYFGSLLTLVQFLDSRLIMLGKNLLTHYYDEGV